MPLQFSHTTRSLDRDDARLAYAGWALGVACLAAWLTWFFAGSVTLHETTKKARVEVKQAPHPVAALLAGRLAASHLALGRQVRAGDILIELDAGPEQARLVEETARLEAFAPRIAAVKREIDALMEASSADQRSSEAAVLAARAREREADAQLSFTRDNERRLAEESAAGGVAQIEALRAQSEARRLGAAKEALGVDARRIDLDARTRARQVQVQVEALRRTAVALAGDMAASEAAVNRLKLDIERRRVRAAVDGRIGDIQTLAVGAYIAEGQKLASIIPAGDLVVVAELDPATALGRVKPGQPAVVRLDGFPWVQYGAPSARVLRVAAEVRDATLRADLAIDATTLRGVPIQHGMPGAVEIEVERVAPAALVLRAAGQWIGGRSTPAEGRGP